MNISYLTIIGEYCCIIIMYIGLYIFQVYMYNYVKENFMSLHPMIEQILW